MLDMLFPEICFLCNTKQSAKGLCETCHDQVAPLDKKQSCKLCKNHCDTITQICSQCLSNNPPWSQSACGFQFNDLGRDLLVRFKYSGHHHLLPIIVDFMEKAFQSEAMGPHDFIIPVPMHPLKKFFRGWNQTELIAREFAKLHPESKFINGLKRPRLTRPQASLNRRQRLKASRDLFCLRNSEILTGGTILLIDDVLTTGATLHACCNALEKAGVRQINILTAARG